MMTTGTSDSWTIAVALATTTCALFACASEPDSGSMAQPNQMAGSGGAITTSGGAGGATGGQGGSSGGVAANGGSGGAAAGSGGMMMAGVGGVMVDPGSGGMAGGGMPDSGTAGAAGDGPDTDGPCTASMATSTRVSGSGPHAVIVETNSDPGINEGTIYRPEDLGGDERYPVFIWGEGGCARDGLSNRAANAEIASHGYIVVADGTPGGREPNRSLGGVDAGAPMIAYIDWVIAENTKPCSAYYHSVDVTKVGTNGFSCGGLMAQGTASDPRVTTWMINSSGGFSANQALYDATHGPVLIVQGGSSDIAYENGKRDYENLAMGTYPVMLFSKDIGHGGDLFSSNGGDFTKLNLAWLNWWLKGDETATGKGFLVGDGCTLCDDSAWETASANIP
jgi:hypothetical protein